MAAPTSQGPASTANLSASVKDLAHASTVSRVNRSVEYSNVTVIVSASGAITT